VTAIRMTQVILKRSCLAAIVMVAACGGQSADPFIAPASPEATVTSFLSAVRSNDLTMMGRLWGTMEGPALGSMESGELQQRLFVMQAYLDHQGFEVMPPDPGAINMPNERSLKIRLLRQGCEVSVPVTVVQTDHGWLVNKIDLNEIGNPNAGCRP
jgi:hypothetical protein